MYLGKLKNIRKQFLKLLKIVRKSFSVKDFTLKYNEKKKNNKINENIEVKF